ncbi:thiol-disulfide interchange protein DsbC [Candidatus Nitrosoglobus terrae]|uniref:Thiol:disulfide interchange protein n=1 Tax=Candidatus Nitrosoglobus terrae TaxID=1630141 RepID=A0A1Q2SM43_9GAMM|nr:DsbC family protein [Candidatus Nitrosoglobus terrae]BAW80208.1 thiol-disulfide interchange protein DsbC [Candidatus Nitrosoglobus terrae]
MEKKISGLLFAGTLAVFSVLVVADEKITSVQTALKKFMPGVQLQSIKPTPIPGLYEIVIEGQVLYFSEDGRYAVQGQLVDLATRTNLTEERMNAVRAKAINALDKRDMIVFGPKEAKYTVNIFTDIDCPYCRQMHQHVDEYNKLGIKIRYLSFPRAGIGSASYDKAVAVWCAKDRQQALTQAKADKPIENTANKCKNPVADQFNLGQSLGVNATPTLILDDGTMLPGFIRPQALVSFLEQHYEKTK